MVQKGLSDVIYSLIDGAVFSEQWYLGVDMGLSIRYDKLALSCAASWLTLAPDQRALGCVELRSYVIA